MSILVSHLQQLSGFRCPFGHRQKGSLSIDINLSEYGVQLGPTTRTIPFSAAHSERLKGRSQHHGMGLAMTSRKHYAEGKTPPSSRTVICVFGTFANSDFTLSVKVYKEKSARCPLMVMTMYTYSWCQHVRRKLHKLVIEKKNAQWARSSGHKGIIGTVRARFWASA
jgi:hypothetical protein